MIVCFDALISHLTQRNQLNGAGLTQRAALTLSALVAPSKLRKLVAQLPRGVPATLQASRLRFPYGHFSRRMHDYFGPHPAPPDVSFDETMSHEKNKVEVQLKLFSQVKTSHESSVHFKNSTRPSCRWSRAHWNEDAGGRASLKSPVVGNKSHCIKARLTDSRAVLVVSSWGGFILYAPVLAPSPWLTLSSLWTSPPGGFRSGSATNIVY